MEIGAEMENLEKTDRRIRRTKKAIKEALIEVLKKKNVENVTIKELADKADITRATFYQYYRDPVDTLEQLQKEICADLQKIVEKTEGGDAAGFLHFYFNIFMKIKQRQIFYRLVCRIRPDMKSWVSIYIINICSDGRISI